MWTIFIVGNLELAHECFMDLFCFGKNIIVSRHYPSSICKGTLNSLLVKKLGISRTDFVMLLLKICLKKKLTRSKTKTNLHGQIFYRN